MSQKGEMPMSVERVWPRTIAGLLIIFAAVSLVGAGLYVGVPVARFLWAARHINCAAPEGDCARAGRAALETSRQGDGG